MDIAAYFNRIGYTGPVAPRATTLRALHRHHMLTVPFENLDIGRRREIVLDPDRFVKKIVSHRRGGFCYELNGAFASLLTALGFRVKLLSVRVADRKGVPSREFDHLALYVRTAARSQEACLRPDLVPQGWLADVGFGENFVEPLRFANGLEQQDAAGRFRLVHGRERWRLERRDEAGEWQLQYDFRLEARRLSEFAGMCRYPSNVARFAFYPQPHLFPGHAERARHAFRHAPDRPLERRTPGTEPHNPGRVALGAPPSLRHCA